MAFKLFVLLAVIATALSLPQYGGYGPVEPQGPAKYNFDWSVQDADSGNNYGHQEERDGDNTQGSYYVLLPDGRTQKVNYYVNGDSGFIADVQYEGQARYDQPPRPSYGYN